MGCKNSFGVLLLMGKEAGMYWYCLLGVLESFSSVTERRSLNEICTALVLLCLCKWLFRKCLTNLNFF